MTGGRTVVAGYDGSDTGRAAVEEAARRAGEGGKLFVVLAVSLPPDFLGKPSYNRLVSEATSAGQEQLDELLGSEALAGVDVETELIGGPAAEAIDRVARTRDADEIVVGSRGLGRVRAALGSVSLALLHLADRPVVVVPGAASEGE
jgi:nucleotide-binding universal stress UspA family protein